MASSSGNPPSPHLHFHVFLAGFSGAGSIVAEHDRGDAACERSSRGNRAQRPAGEPSLFLVCESGRSLAAGVTAGLDHLRTSGLDLGEQLLEGHAAWNSAR